VEYPFGQAQIVALYYFKGAQNEFKINFRRQKG